MTDKRKKRADAGHSTLSRDEAALISATLREGPPVRTVSACIPSQMRWQPLRANGFITAGRTDETTGEVFPAVRGYHQPCPA